MYAHLKNQSWHIIISASNCHKVTDTVLRKENQHLNLARGPYNG